MTFEDKRLALEAQIEEEERMACEAEIEEYPTVFLHELRAYYASDQLAAGERDLLPAVERVLRRRGQLKE